MSLKSLFKSMQYPHEKYRNTSYVGGCIWTLCKKQPSLAVFHCSEITFNTAFLKSVIFYRELFFVLFSLFSRLFENLNARILNHPRLYSNIGEGWVYLSVSAGILICLELPAII